MGYGVSTHLYTLLKIQVSWDMTPCEWYLTFRGIGVSPFSRATLRAPFASTSDSCGKSTRLRIPYWMTTLQSEHYYVMNCRTLQPDTGLVPPSAARDTFIGCVSPVPLRYPVCLCDATTGPVCKIKMAATQHVRSDIGDCTLAVLMHNLILPVGKRIRSVRKITPNI